MTTNIKKIEQFPDVSTVVLLAKAPETLDDKFLKKEEILYIKSHKDKDKTECYAFNHFSHWVFVQFIKDENELYKRLEAYRKAGDEISSKLNKYKIESVILFDSENMPEETLALAEGIALANYKFTKYFSDKEKEDKKTSLNTINILSEKLGEERINELNIITEGVNWCRNLVNEPVSGLNSVKLAEEFIKMGNSSGVKVEVFNKKKIESMKMGGLLAVNKGSVDPPTFTVMEWKPESPVNNKPIVLVGKGVVYDTGGLNLKPGAFMENMKTDMSGAAVMASVVCTVAKSGLPVHLIALLPATDNRPDGNAYASGDVIKMHNGKTVEVINTDAEGRLILADALSYAQKYSPELVIDAATLTGSAVRAIGKFGIVAMEAGAPDDMKKLKESGMSVYERIVEFPMWDEYAELLKSEIADLKNLGPPEAGMITAGKFLEKFTDYPFIHLDIAGVAFAEKRDSYRNIGATGTGVRLLYDFIKYK